MNTISTMKDKKVARETDALGGGGPMLVPPVVQGGTGGRQVGDAGARTPQNSASATATTALWPIAPVQAHPSATQQPQAPLPSAIASAPSHNQGINRYELYSLFPGSGGGSYVATTPNTPVASSTRAYHATTHKVSESVFSAAVGVGGVGGYTWGAPTPPPGSPYSPVPAVTQLELLAKNLATLTPHHTQQSLNLQGAVGVNVGASLHHAHHTQHTLNLAGLHHLHHGESTMTTTSATSFTSKFIDDRTLTLGGLHQSPFSPQLSLVTAGTPSLTINNFSSPSAQASIVPTSGGVIVQEYQSAGPNPIGGCQSATSASSMTTTNGCAAGNVNTSVMVHGTTAATGPLDTNFVQSTLTKKRESFITAQAQTSIKVENKTTSQSCICKNTNVTNISGKTKNIHSEVGCSRTLPVISSWNSQDSYTYTNAISQSAATNLVKRESLATVPCQVAEVSTSLHATTTAVKIEPLPPSKSKNGIVASSSTSTGIPVGIAVARQRLQHQETSTSMRNVSLSHHTSHHASYHHFQPDNLGSATAMAMGGTALLHCGNGGDDRTAHLAIPTGTLTPSINTATLHSGLGSIGPGAPSAWPPTLWQYPTTAMPALEPIGFPQVGVGLQGGLQLVRDPTTGHLLLIHAAAEQMQQAVLWPNYSNHGGPNVGAPSPFLLPGTTPPSLQLLSDINGARLVLTENKRKQHSTVPIVKIEADCASPNTTLIASAESNKALHTVTTMTGSVIPDSPLLTTLHYYPHAPALVQISHAESTQCRTQQRNTFIPKTTSPVSCLTPPPENTNAIDGVERNSVLAVQDASNQTDAPDIDDHFSIDGLIKQEQRFSVCNQTIIAPRTNFDAVSSSVQRSRTPNSSSSINDSSVIHYTPDVIFNRGSESQNFETRDSHAIKSEDVNLIDQTIERVVSCKSNHTDPDDTESVIDEDSILEKRMSRFGSRLIEITEENCDSFHENLEFFGRRRDPVEKYHKPYHSDQEEISNQQNVNEKMISPSPKNNEINEAEILVTDQDVCHSISSTFDDSHTLSHTDNINEHSETVKLFSEPLKPSKIDSNCTTEIEKSTIESPTIIKSLDMPSIDCDEQQQNDISVKQEVEETRYSTDLHTLELNNTNNTIREKGILIDKKQLSDKYHPGIENVVEKLKKNAAAAALHDCTTLEKSTDCKQQKNDIHPTKSDATSQNIKSDNRLKKCISELCETISNTPDSKIDSKEETDKISSDAFNKVHTKQKSNVDLSGLELLSNSIAQLEQLKPAENSPIKENSLDQQKESNNNDVDSPLGLLCALAEQRFMEEVGHNVPKRNINYENSGNSDEISHAGILLINLGKVNGQEHTKDEKQIVEKQNLNKNDSNNDNNNDNDCNITKCSQPSEIDKLKIEKDKICNDIVVVDNVINFSHEYEADADDDCTDSETENSKNKSFSSAYHYLNHQTINDESSISCDQININTSKQKNNDDNWRPHSNMDAVELNMREKLAEIQKKYKQKQIELSKFSPKKEDLIYHKGSQKRNSEDESLSIDNKQEDKLSMKSSIESCNDIAPPPPPSPTVLSIPRCNANLVKLGEPRSHIKLLDSIPSIPISVSPHTTPEAVSSIDITNADDEVINSVVTMSYDAASPTSTTSNSISASKKRKVGRPRKFMCTSTSAKHLTETIVSKKSRTKSSLISYLLNSKNKQHQCKYNGKGNHNSLSFKYGVSNVKGITKGINKTAKSRILKPVKQTPLHNKNVICSIIAEKAKLSQEVKLERHVMKWKSSIATEVMENECNPEINKELNDSSKGITNEKNKLLIEHHQLSKQPPIHESLNEIITDKNENTPDKCQKLKKKKRKSMSSSPQRHKTDCTDKKESKRRKSSECKECKECARVAKAEKMENIDNITNKCKLTSAHLSIDQMRVLTAMGGLFYAGRLSAVQAPDIYAITLDGERGNRPHIHSREEILRDAIVEICPTSTKELPPGTRLCAYWSQQYRCLYPGTSVEPSDPDSELDEKFVSVEFDDGDSGKIALNDIRLLQPDYPVVEYDPNPLLTLGKRRRQTSTSTSTSTDDKHPANIKLLNSQSTSESTSNVNSNNTEIVKKISNFNETSLDEYRERKKLKKRRRDKLKRLKDVEFIDDGKRKHRRHKCCEEHRKHKHRKHRKHKRRHSHHASYSEGSHFSGGDSCSGHISEVDTNESAIDKNEVSSVINELEHVDNVVVASSKSSKLPKVNEEQVAIVKTDKLKKSEKKSKTKDRQETVESRSKMAAFLPARQLWEWSGKGYRRPGAKGRAKKQFFKAIQRGNEAIQIGDSAVFLSTGRPDRPYIGRIESMWETTNSNMIVKVKWFYHPEETVGAPANLKYPGALFESPHMDENDVQTISHKCEVLPLCDYAAKLEKEPQRYLTIYDINDIYYLAGYYDPTTYLLTLQSGVV